MLNWKFLLFWNSCFLLHNFLSNLNESLWISLILYKSKWIYLSISIFSCLIEHLDANLRIIWRLLNIFPMTFSSALDLFFWRIYHLLLQLLMMFHQKLSVLILFLFFVFHHLKFYFQLFEQLAPMDIFFFILHMIELIHLLRQIVLYNFLRALWANFQVDFNFSLFFNI